jgi:hypothetical protein
MYLSDRMPSPSSWPAGEALGATATTVRTIRPSARRRRIGDSAEAPYRWICAVDALFPPGDRSGKLSRVTGFLISPRHVVTAAANLVAVKAPTRESQPASGIRIDALKVTVTPALDGTPRLGRKRAPVGAIDLRQPQWWIPDQYFTEFSFKWNVALLTLPKELPAFRGTHYGHWGDSLFSPRTTIEAATSQSLVNTTLTTCGYPDGECTQELPPPSAANPYPQPSDAIRLVKHWSSNQWETFGRVQPSQPGLADWGLLAYDTAGCYGMEGAPVWQNTGRLRLVGLHVASNFRNDTNQHLPPILGVALAFRPEILDLLRQRVRLAGITPAF